MSLAEAVAHAFDLGRPRRELTDRAPSSFVTWRLETTSGAYLVKRMWAGPRPHWWTRLPLGMNFERRAMAARIPTARPISPVVQADHWLAQLGDHGGFRVYEWVPHRPVTPDDDITDWAAEVLLRLHRIEPIADPPDPEWRWLDVHPPSTWERWIAAGEALDRPWVDAVRTQLPDLLALTDRIRSAYRDGADHVLVHGDMRPENVLLTDDGPVLIDWDSVACDRASIETVGAASKFGYQDIARMQRFLDAYRAAGGVLPDIATPLFMRWATPPTELIMTSVGERDPSRQKDPATLDQRVLEGLATIPKALDRIEKLADRLS